MDIGLLSHSSAMPSCGETFGSAQGVHACHIACASSTDACLNRAGNVVERVSWLDQGVMHGNASGNKTSRRQRQLRSLLSLAAAHLPGRYTRVHCAEGNLPSCRSSSLGDCRQRLQASIICAEIVAFNTLLQLQDIAYQLTDLLLRVLSCRQHPAQGYSSWWAGQCRTKWIPL